MKQAADEHPATLFAGLSARALVVPSAELVRGQRALRGAPAPGPPRQPAPLASAEGGVPTPERRPLLAPSVEHVDANGTARAGDGWGRPKYRFRGTLVSLEAHGTSLVLTLNASYCDYICTSARVMLPTARCARTSEIAFRSVLTFPLRISVRCACGVPCPCS